MTAAVQQVLDSFEALSPTEQRELAAVLLRRLHDATPPDVSEEGLVEVAEALFLELDAREAADAESNAG